MDNLDAVRVQAWQDWTTDTTHTPDLADHVFELLTQYREGTMRPAVNAAFADSLSAVSLAMQDLDHTVALLNAYITMASPDGVAQSEIIRSAFRAAPGSSEIGLKSEDVLQLILDFQDAAAARDARSPADADYDFHVIDQILNERIDFVHAELLEAIAIPLESPPYIEWMIKELVDLRDHAFGLARDDMYEISGTMSVDEHAGVMENDILQAYRTIMVDPGFGDLPAHGSLTLNPDGSFEYTPNAGYVGTDSFTYRLVGTIVEGQPIPEDGQFVSEPATVVLQVESGACSEADLNADGELDFFDVSAFLVAFTASDPAADFREDGEFDFFDVSAFLVAFGAGCP